MREKGRGIFLSSSSFYMSHFYTHDVITFNVECPIATSVFSFKFKLRPQLQLEVLRCHGARDCVLGLPTSICYCSESVLGHIMFRPPSAGPSSECLSAYPELVKSSWSDSESTRISLKE